MYHFQLAHRLRRYISYPLSPAKGVELLENLLYWESADPNSKRVQELAQAEGVSGRTVIGSQIKQSIEEYKEWEKYYYPRGVVPIKLYPLVAKYRNRVLYEAAEMINRHEYTDRREKMRLEYDKRISIERKESKL